MKEYGRKRGGRGGSSAGKSRQAGKRQERTVPSSRDPAMPAEESIRIQAAEAEVVAVEAHVKRPGMYKVAIRLFGNDDQDATGQNGHVSGYETDAKPADWNEEVDALIAGAAKASSSGIAETVVTVHEDTLVALRLLKGRRLSPEEWESLRGEEEREDAYRAALAILERKARTSRELSDALKRKGYAPEVIASCLERLQSRRMLDDSSFAKRFAEQRATGQRKGRRLIRQELLQRGIAKEDADRAIGELDGNAELESAVALARKKWPQLKGETRERKHKLAAFLLRRGYPGGVARQALDRVLAEDAERHGVGEYADESDVVDDWEMAGPELSDDLD